MKYFSEVRYVIVHDYISQASMDKEFQGDTRVSTFIMDMKEKLVGFESKLGGHDWFVGGKLSYLDFFLYEMFDHIRCLFPTRYATGSIVNITVWNYILILKLTLLFFR